MLELGILVWPSYVCIFILCLSVALLGGFSCIDDLGWIRTEFKGAFEFCCWVLLLLFFIGIDFWHQRYLMTESCRSLDDITSIAMSDIFISSCREEQMNDF